MISVSDNSYRPSYSMVLSRNSKVSKKSGPVTLTFDIWTWDSMGFLMLLRWDFQHESAHFNKKCQSSEIIHQVYSITVKNRHLNFPIIKALCNKLFRLVIISDPKHVPWTNVLRSNYVLTTEATSKRNLFLIESFWDELSL